MNDIAKLVNMDPAFIIGAGAGPFPFAGVNCEVKLPYELLSLDKD